MFLWVYYRYAMSGFNKFSNVLRKRVSVVLCGINCQLSVLYAGYKSFKTLYYAKIHI
jgi:hypothetical protein